MGALADVGQYFALCVKSEDGEDEIALLHLEDDPEFGRIMAIAVYTAPESVVQQRHLARFEETMISPISPEELLDAMPPGVPSTVFLDGRKLAASVFNGMLKQELGLPIKRPRLIQRKPADALREEFVLSESQNPKIIGPPNPEHKAQEIERAIGKTIEAVEYGVVEGLLGWVHEGEAIVLHFTDRTALSIEIGSNAKNLSYEYEGLKPEDVHTDIMPIWREGPSPG